MRTFFLRQGDTPTSLAEKNRVRPQEDTFLRPLTCDAFAGSGSDVNDEEGKPAGEEKAHDDAEGELCLVVCLDAPPMTPMRVVTMFGVAVDGTFAFRALDFRCMLSCRAVQNAIKC